MLSDITLSSVFAGVAVCVATSVVIAATGFDVVSFFGEASSAVENVFSNIANPEATSQFASSEQFQYAPSAEGAGSSYDAHAGHNHAPGAHGSGSTFNFVEPYHLR